MGRGPPIELHVYLVTSATPPGILHMPGVYANVQLVTFAPNFKCYPPPVTNAKAWNLIHMHNLTVYSKAPLPAYIHVVTLR